MKIGFLSDRLIYFLFTLIIMVACLALIWHFSGCKHESVKIKTVAMHVFLVVLGQFLLSDTIKFLLISIDKATWPNLQTTFLNERRPIVHTRTQYLKMRLNILRAQLRHGQDHINEPLNLKFQLISLDLCLYGTYFLLLTSVVLVTRDELLYYNTDMMKKIFSTNRTYTLGLNYVQELDQFYTFLEVSLINAFDSKVKETGYRSWMYGDQTAKLGVIRLRQLRHKEEYHLGWGSPQFSSLDYMPNWKLPYERMAYTDKYWNIYLPWLPSSVRYSTLEKIFLNPKHTGYCENFPETMGYITMLARSRNNSMKVVDYLEQNNWVNTQTAAVFIDFTLYNADANIFTICNLLVERTPFGTLEPRVEVQSIKLQVLDQLGTLGLIVSIIYVLVLIQFSKTLVVTLWYEPSKLRSMWNILDLIILVLNIVVVILIIIQEFMVSTLLEQIEYANKLQFLDFRRPAIVKDACSIVLGLLVLFTTLRLWKVLQFSSVFQLFSHALFSAWQALASTALLISIFLVAFGIAVAIINGNNTMNFNYIMRSIANSLCFSFGFSQHISPNDLFYGGKPMGIILYLILTFVIAQLLINVFVSTINGYFVYAKSMRDAKAEQPINFLQFLRVEYHGIFEMFRKVPCINRGYRSGNRTVADYVKYTLDDRHKKSVKSKHHALAIRFQRGDENLDEATKHENYKKRIVRLYNIASVMQTQMQLLEHFWELDVDKTKKDKPRSPKEEDSESDEDYSV
ncbi:hypothetical protein KR215_006554 [Drosophila sulfurigaster]|nr:hypothetical protein KR215_006554 [Drosophila sulfurigaster]